MVLKNVFFAFVSVFIATHFYEQGRIYFAVTCPNISSVHTCNQSAVVPYHFAFSNFGRLTARLDPPLCAHYGRPAPMAVAFR